MLANSATVRATLCSALFSLPYLMGLLMPVPTVETYLERGKRMRLVLTFILLFRCQSHQDIYTLKLQKASSIFTSVFT